MFLFVEDIHDDEKAFVLNNIVKIEEDVFSEEVGAKLEAHQAYQCFHICRCSNHAHVLNAVTPILLGGFR